MPRSIVKYNKKDFIQKGDTVSRIRDTSTELTKCCVICSLIAIGSLLPNRLAIGRGHLWLVWQLLLLYKTFLISTFCVCTHCPCVMSGEAGCLRERAEEGLQEARHEVSPRQEP